MADVLVTGCAGFIGSNLADACLRRGDRVTGVDSLDDYYDVAQKRRNLAALARHKRFTFIEQDLADRTDDLVAGTDLVLHQAGQPGVRSSWSDGFAAYLRSNVQATQALLEACVRQKVSRLVYASSSSVYGRAASYPVTEQSLPQPHSPYGVTKLAGEHLCSLYAANHGLSVVSLRYFTVYGPRQRPDMATFRIIEAALHGAVFPVFGDGTQVRDFTYVGDVARANLLAGDADVAPGQVFNIAGGSQVSLLELIALTSEICGRPVEVEHQPVASGDVRRTSASNHAAREVLRWEPEVSVREGVEHQYRWQLTRDEAEA